MTQQAETHIDVRQAIAKAREYIKYLYADEHLDRLMLEEVELSESIYGNNWVITFGFDVPVPHRSTRMPDEYFTQEYERAYRDILVDAVTGEVHSMRTRKI